MLPNISPPIDRSEKAMQGVQYRGPQQAYHGSVTASNPIACAICMAGCDLLPALHATPDHDELVLLRQLDHGLFCLKRRGEESIRGLLDERGRPHLGQHDQPCAGLRGRTDSGDGLLPVVFDVTALHVELDAGAGEAGAIVGRLGHVSPEDTG